MLLPSYLQPAAGLTSTIPHGSSPIDHDPARLSRAAADADSEDVGRQEIRMMERSNGMRIFAFWFCSLGALGFAMLLGWTWPW